MNDQNISLEQSLQAYRLLHTPVELSWKQHWVNEKFSSPDVMKLEDEEKERYFKRLLACNMSYGKGIKAIKCDVATLKDLYNILTNPDNKKINKLNRWVIFSTSNGVRPIGQKGLVDWNGFQIIDMDIHDHEMAGKVKTRLFERLYKYNWFLGIAFSSSGTGLHVYTKIQVAESEEKDIRKKKLLYFTNFRHKYSFVYLACLKFADELGFDRDDLMFGNGKAGTSSKPWMDLAMFKPQQGAFIGYDEHPLFNSNFFEDFIYVNFDNVEDMGHPDVDWVSYPDLKDLFKRWEWFEEKEKDKEKINIEVRSAEELIVDTHNKVHYKHFERWRLANTLVKLYGLDLGYKYLRMICSNAVNDKEIQSDCITASRHDKPVDVWAVNILNRQHGFKIKLNVNYEETGDIQDLYTSIDSISNPTLIKESNNYKEFHIKSNEYLSTIRIELFKNLGKITLIEAGAGVGKTEMVKQLARQGKRVMMVMPFTSTIKSKVEGDKDWMFCYGNRKVRLDTEKSISLTIDKFSHINLLELKEAGFDYIIIDESHLMFQSEYRDVMPKVIEMIKNAEVPIIMMSGTPVGETIFFPELTHLKVIKDDTRKKEFTIHIADNPSDTFKFMCKQMADDVANGKKVLYPTNNGTLFAAQIEAAVNFFLINTYQISTPVKLNYYKKANIGEKFMDDINFKKTVADTDILLCSNYLSVGVDILDRSEFNIYINDLWMPQEIEQFANRLRSHDLFINLYIAKNDANGVSNNIYKYNTIDLRLSDDEMKDCLSVLELCNKMIKRNPIEYKYNPFIQSLLFQNKFIEYNDIENKYYLNEIAYKTIFFERKYRAYVQQLPVIAKGMQCYGYTYSSIDHGVFKVDDSDLSYELDVAIKKNRENVVAMNTECINELLDIITEDRLGIYKNVIQGKYEIKKGKDWKEDNVNNKMTVKNIEIFEKVIPIFTSMSKLYTVETIKNIFDYCKDKKGRYNFAAIRRIRLLINIMYNDKNDRLDIPINQFMNDINRFISVEERTKNEIEEFLYNWTVKYAKMESSDDIIIENSPVTMESMKNSLEKIFDALVNKSRPKKKGIIKLSKVELLWKERQVEENDYNDKLYFLSDFLDISSTIKTQVIE